MLLVRLLVGDLSLLSVSALVTGANPTMSGNLNGNYWRFNGRKNINGEKAGSALVLAVATLPSTTDGAKCQVGEAVVKFAWKLAASRLIHTVCPDGINTTVGGND